MKVKERKQSLLSYDACDRAKLNVKTLIDAPRRAASLKADQHSTMQPTILIDAYRRKAEHILIMVSDVRAGKHINEFNLVLNTTVTIS